MLKNVASSNMHIKTTTFALLLLFVFSICGQTAPKPLDKQFFLSPQTIMTNNVKNVQREELYKAIRIIYPNFVDSYKDQILDTFLPILDKKDKRHLLLNLFKKSDDGLYKLSPYTHWDADTKNIFPSTVDKTQWLVVSSKEPFSYSENRYNASGADADIFSEAIKVGDNYYALVAPVNKGGKKKLTILKKDAEPEVRYFKRENINSYVKYTFFLLKRFKKYLSRETENPLTNKLTAILKNKIGEKKLDAIFSDFALDTRGTYTRRTETNKITIFGLRPNLNRNFPYLSVSFKLINAFKRGRIHLSEYKLLNLMLLDVAASHDLEQEIVVSLNEDEKKLFDDLIVIKNRLRGADLKNESDMRILQLNSRVKGQRPKDITDEQIAEWKNTGVNMVYFMGAWKTSPFSKMYNKFWGNKAGSLKEREASAFAVTGYQINPEIATSAEFNSLRKRLNKAGIKVMLDFIPNHMAMDNDYLPEHPEYFLHDRLDDNHYIDNGAYDSYDPDNWEKHPDGKTKYRMWYSKNFDEQWGSDHFLLQEMDENGNQLKVTKFYHGNKSWRDTVQINYQHPKAREFMRKNAVKAAYRAGGGGLRWDFVHVVLQKHFNQSWQGKSMNDFLRRWKGVDHIPQKSHEEWNNLFVDFLKENDYPPSASADEKAREMLEEIIENFKTFLLEKKDMEYSSLAPAFHTEGLINVIKDHLYPNLGHDDYREIFDSVPNLRFHETIERTVNALRYAFPDIINIAEAYEEEAYIHNLGIDAIYGANMHKVLVENAADGRSFFDSVHDFFNIVRENSKIWELKNHVFYMQNFDENPAITFISKEDIIYKASLLYGLPGVKYFEWGLVEGNTNRLGADWIYPEPSPILKKELKPFFTEIINISSDEIITHGTLSQLDLGDNVRAYKRKYKQDSITVIANIVEEERKISLETLNLQNDIDLYAILSTNKNTYIKNGYLYLAPKSVIWLKEQLRAKDISDMLKVAA